MNDNNNNENIVLPNGSDLVLSVSPHVSNRDNTRGIMLKVVLALVPAMIAGVWFFGLDALRVILLTAAFTVLAEALWCAMLKKPVKANVFDGSALVTGVLLACNLPSAAPWWVCLIGAFIAIWLGKQIFGGLGRNPFNPALVARVALLIALPAIMTTWPTPHNDAETSATPLGIVGTTTKITGHSQAARQNFQTVDNSSSLKEYFIGNRGGCLGETSAIALLIGGLALIAMKLIKWQVPVCFIGTVAVITGATHLLAPGVTPGPLFHVMTGGLLLGAFFMATDMVTSPISTRGCVFFAIGCGVITSVIRIWGNYPEGVSFSILLMNALVPLIDRWCLARPFGYTVKREKA
ncbi:MAG: RnfABCDGE type electron transport complex subunit D [Victivallaceae bacterium]|nr:RnfABCDGE type electron transport complex subunit D [Victivallaceae bacterium]